MSRALLSLAGFEVTLIGRFCVTAEDRCHHFYEIPLTESFLEGRQRTRETTVALAHNPAVRAPTIPYKSCGMEFRLVWSDGLAHVTRMFNAVTSREEYQRISSQEKLLTL